MGEKCAALHGVPTHFLAVLAEVERRRSDGTGVKDGENGGRGQLGEKGEKSDKHIPYRNSKVGIAVMGAGRMLTCFFLFSAYVSPTKLPQWELEDSHGSQSFASGHPP